jgi:hypothetical protein
MAFVPFVKGGGKAPAKGAAKGKVGAKGAGKAGAKGAKAPARGNPFGKKAKGK